eukprot:scaffold70403_cov17-Tisochrysis_lutea.AAC.1
MACAAGFLASGGRDSVIHIYAVANKYALVNTLEDHSASVTAVRFRPTPATQKSWAGYRMAGWLTSIPARERCPHYLEAKGWLGCGGAQLCSSCIYKFRCTEVQNR